MITICKLFIKECKFMMKSAVYMLYGTLILIFFYFGFVNDVQTSKYMPPQPTDFKLINDATDNEIINDGFTRLYISWFKNEYEVLINSDSKNSSDVRTELISLGSAQQNEINIIINSVARDLFYDKIQIEMFEQESGFIDIPIFNEHQFSIPIDQFYVYMIKAGKIIGGSNPFLNPKLFSGKVRQATYDEMMSLYEKEVVETFFGTEKLTRGLSRVFADRMAVIIAILSIFCVVFICLKDKIYKTFELINYRKISSLSFVLGRYASIVFMLMMPIIAVSIIALLYSINIANLYDVNSIDYIAFLSTTIVWILPTVMFISAVGMFFTYLTDTPIAIIVFIFWWSTIHLSGMGDYSITNYFVRFPTEFSYEMFNVYKNDIYSNRIFYVISSMAVVALTALIVYLKRRGRLGSFKYFEKLFKSYFNKPKNLPDA